MPVKKYSELLKQRFLEQICGEKLLIYQEDVYYYMEHRRILDYDYVGAPWRNINYQSNCSNGFSLRSNCYA